MGKVRGKCPGGKCPRPQKAFVIPLMMYGSEFWCLRKEDERRILVAEMSWLRRILGRSRRDRIRNKVTRKELGQQVTLVDKIRKRRLTWFEHITRMEGNRLQVVALYGQVEGTRSRGRQPKKWIENVKEDLTAQGMNMREAVDNSRNRGSGKVLLRPHRRRTPDGGEIGLEIG